MKKLFIIGIFIILTVTVATIKSDDIMYWFKHDFQKKEFSVVVPNKYFLKDNYLYVNNHNNNAISNKKQLLDFIYYFINSGADTIDGYCTKDYTNCIHDIEIISADQETLSILNNFVHPYNSFSSFKILYNTKGEFTLNIEKLYTNEQINTINKITDEYIQNNINKNMTTREKIKIIHDYIISTTDYDQLKTTNIEDTTYHSQNAYGVLVEHYGICSGYSDAMSIFLNKLGIINYKISNDEHIWNLAFVDGKWLHIDLTWNDPLTESNANRDNYFLITSKKLIELNDDSHDFNKHIFQEG